MDCPIHNDKISMELSILYFKGALSGQYFYILRERSGSVVECLTRDRRAAGSSLTGVSALWSMIKTNLYPVPV